MTKRRATRPSFKFVVSFANGKTMQVEIRATSQDEARAYAMRKCGCPAQSETGGFVVTRPISAVAA